MGEESEVVGSLRLVNERLRSVVATTTETVIRRSAAPGAMRLAYAAIDGEIPGEEGRASLRRALVEDGLPPDVIDSIDALYVRCLLDPSIA